MKKVLVAGCGNMAQALLSPIGKSLAGKVEWLTFTPSKTRALKLAAQLAGEALDSLGELEDLEVDTLFLACKPQQLQELVALLPKARFKTVLSVLAGVTCRTLQEIIDCDQVIRVMPNTPSKAREGANLMFAAESKAAGKNGDDQERVFWQETLRLCGPMFLLDSEEKIDALTPLSGSGPAYVFELCRIWRDYAKKYMGEKEALELVVQTIKGSVALLEASEASPEMLRDQVTSKKGVTEEALSILSREKLPEIFDQAFRAGYDRAIELAKGR